jgi:hypothetical protein
MFLAKAIISGLVVASVSWLAARNATFAAVMMGIPFTAFLSLIVMHYSGVPAETMAQFSWETILFVVLSLTFFVVFPIMITHYGFWISMMTAFVVSAVVFSIGMEIVSWLK